MYTPHEQALWKHCWRISLSCFSSPTPFSDCGKELLRCVQYESVIQACQPAPPAMHLQGFGYVLNKDVLTAELVFSPRACLKKPPDRALKNGHIRFDMADCHSLSTSTKALKSSVITLARNFNNIAAEWDTPSSVVRHVRYPAARTVAMPRALISPNGVAKWRICFPRCSSRIRLLSAISFASSSTDRRFR